MDNFKKYFELISGDKYKREAAVDDCHSALLFGTILSQKPENVLEIGVGTGFISKTILYALKYNNKGKLTCVDNMGDWKGGHDNITPSIVDFVVNLGATFIKSTEEEYVKKCNSNEYDLLISDGDHPNAHKWKEEIFRIVRPNGFMFFHDVNKYAWNLYEYVDYAKANNLPYYLFNESTRPEEECKRGWLMVINKK